MRVFVVLECLQITSIVPVTISIVATVIGHVLPSMETGDLIGVLHPPSTVNLNDLATMVATNPSDATNRSRSATRLPSSGRSAVKLAKTLRFAELQGLGGPSARNLY